MWKELILSFRDRIRNPFFSYFVLSWLVWNWKLLFYILFQDFNVSVTSKISYIKENFTGWDVNLVFPFLTALLFFVSYQFLSMYTIWFWNLMRVKHKEFKAKATNEEVYTKTEYDELVGIASDSKTELDNCKKQLTERLSAQEREILERQFDIEKKSYLGKFAEEKKRLEEKINELSQDKKNVTQDLDKSNKRITHLETNLEKNTKDLKRFKKGYVDLTILYQVYSLVERKEDDEDLISEIHKFCENYYKLDPEGTSREIIKDLKQIIGRFQIKKNNKIFDEIYKIFEPILRESEIHKKAKIVLDILDEHKGVPPKPTTG